MSFLQRTRILYAIGIVDMRSGEVVKGSEEFTVPTTASRTGVRHRHRGLTPVVPRREFARAVAVAEVTVSNGQVRDVRCLPVRSRMSGECI
ncbi:hypothetical protein ATK36_2032 [Amycolatopsis sulphurea]|uniref:Uncharacterized protein n=1 Tax=Amycolatopsis sulphurea TaxID=76022 RepID=A0A2A9F8Z9_9PSEU|nr:hypothetical protein ATK36_2032 [Amycolatopsis sulphurea]